MSRRLLLVRATKLLVLAGLAFAAYPFLAALLPDAAVDATRQQQWRRELDLSSLRTGELLYIYDWPGGPLAIYRRTAHELEGLGRIDEQLHDPSSHYSRQPAHLQTATRSYLTDYFVFVPVDTDRGCQLRRLPADKQPKVGIAWYGGFTESCNGSLYDTAGRVYRDHRSARQQNLHVPAYQATGKARIRLTGPAPIGNL